MVDRGMCIAIKEARRSTCRYFKVGAALIRKKTVLGRGRNSRKTSPGSRARYNGIHAEYQCVRKFSGFADKEPFIGRATMFVARITKSGSSLAMAKPCIACQSVMSRLGIKRVYYTINNDLIGFMTI